MPTQQTISTSKIFAFVIFISAALITSLFVYHWRQTQTSPIFADGTVTVFPAPRELKNINLVNANETKFSQQSLTGHWTLLFFGFTHCSQVCPNTLGMLSHSYCQLKSDYPNLQVVLISLDPDRDDLKTLAQYTSRFHKDFIGVTGKIENLRKLQSQLGVAAVMDNQNPNNYQINHTASIYLINPQGKWAGLFSYGLTPQQLNERFRESVRVLS